MREIRAIDEALSETKDAYFKQRHQIYANYLEFDAEPLFRNVVDQDAKAPDVFRH